MTYAKTARTLGAVALAATMTVGQASAECLSKIDVSVWLADDDWVPKAKVNPRKDVLHYGDLMRLQLTGRLPGVFHMFSINPLDVRNDDYPAIYSDGASAVMLPCGTGARPACAEFNAPLEIYDDFDGARDDRIDLERLVVTYTPCLSGNRDLDARFTGLAAGTIKTCEALLGDPALLATNYERHTFESVRIATRKKGGCDVDSLSADGMIIAETLNIRAARR